MKINQDVVLYGREAALLPYTAKHFNKLVHTARPRKAKIKNEEKKKGGKMEKKEKREREKEEEGKGKKGVRDGDSRIMQRLC